MAEVFCIETLGFTIDNIIYTQLCCKTNSTLPQKYFPYKESFLITRDKNIESKLINSTMYYNRIYLYGDLTATIQVFMRHFLRNSLGIMLLQMLLHIWEKYFIAFHWFSYFNILNLAHKQLARIYVEYSETSTIYNVYKQIYFVYSC